jgi:uncharacterized protein YndB with AHSA1/START domain
MSVTDVRKNLAELSLIITSEFRAPPERVWQLWADPRQLERWWGPPAYPATVTTHELRKGGRVEYHMTGPEGDQPRGYWEIDEVHAPHSLAFRDGFANPDGSPHSDLPTISMHVTIEEAAGGRTRMSIHSIFPTIEAMERILEMGMEEGMKQALNQIDAILTEDQEIQA